MTLERWKKVMAVLVCLLVLWSGLEGIFSNEPVGPSTFTNLYGQSIPLKGTGLYYRDSLSVASQGMAQDCFTIMIGLPLLLWSTFGLGKKPLLKKSLAMGLYAYFLYTYVSYVFLWQFNHHFLTYVAVMGISFYGLMLSAIALDRRELKRAYRGKLPLKLIGGFQIFISLMVGLMWLSKVVSSLNAGIPEGLEHYTTYVIQGLDLGILVPSAILSGVLIIRNRSWGYYLSTLIVFKLTALLLAIVFMLVGMTNAGVEVAKSEYFTFGSFALLSIICFVFMVIRLDESL